MLTTFSRRRIAFAGYVGPELSRHDDIQYSYIMFVMVVSWHVIMGVYVYTTDVSQNFQDFLQFSLKRKLIHNTVLKKETLSLVNEHNWY